MNRENKMETKELNDKLLKFAGIEFQKHEPIYGNIKLPFSGYFLNGKCIRKTAPDLVHDLNAQQKYLYPKLKGKDWSIIAYQRGGFGAYADYPHFGVNANSASLAFALVCEKYIDSLSNNEVKNE